MATIINTEKFDDLASNLISEVSKQADAISQRILELADVEQELESLLDKWETEYPDELGYDTDEYEEINDKLISINAEIEELERDQYDLEKMQSALAAFLYPNDKNIDADDNSALIDQYLKYKKLDLPTPEEKYSAELSPKFKVIGVNGEGKEILLGTFTTEEKANKFLADDWYAKKHDGKVVAI